MNRVVNGISSKQISAELISQCNSLMKRKPSRWCCVVIDIEQFQLFNSVFGNEKGAQLINQYNVMLKCFEDSVSGYLGSDNFFLFTEYNIGKIDGLVTEMISYVEKLSGSVGFKPAFGIYRLDNQEYVTQLAYQKACAALLDAKESRRSRLKIYDPQIHHIEDLETKILLELKDASSRGEITIYLQPQCRISTRKIVGAEALVRWIRPDGTMVSPAEFIPILENRGFIADLDKQIWEMVCKWLSSLLDRGIPAVPVSINVSQVDILTMDVAEYLADLCDRYRIPHKLLAVEITETSYAEEYEMVKELVCKLQILGFTAFMDDFGTGYSSLNMLEKIAINVLKLDMGFMKNDNAHSRKGITIIESIINMSKMMGIPMIVEGVETQEQVDFLNSTGCRYAQGFFYYRPMPLAEFENLLLEKRVDLRGFINKRNEQIHVREFLDENTFTDTMLNNVLGAVGFYSLEGKDLTITRFNQQFYKVIGDPNMETRQSAIQNYVVRDDWPDLYRALDDAIKNPTEGGICEIRFYKSEGGVFWFKLHFFYLEKEADRFIFYGQIDDITESREQSLQFLEMLRDRSDVAMMMNLDRRKVQYVTKGNTLSQIGLPSMDLEISNQRTAEMRFDEDEEREKFKQFFDIERLKDSHRHAIYHEKIVLNFKLYDKPEPVEFSTYYIRWNKDHDLVVYVFVRKVN